MIRSTWELYRRTARLAAASLGRSAIAFALLLALGPLMTLLATVTMRVPVLGGFLQGLIQATAIGWYLSMLEGATTSSRPLRFGDLKGRFGHYWSEVISVLFFFWLAQLLLEPAAPGLMMLLLPVASLAFNPVPEMLVQERSRSMALLADAAKFMQNNWPEWLVPHAVVFAVLAGWAAVFHIPIDGWSGLARLSQWFGPFFSFIEIGATIAFLPGELAIIAGLSLAAVVHAFLIFRQHLYREMRTSSRRSREWAARR